jgi:ArsR family transcriptional regulator
LNASQQPSESESDDITTKPRIINLPTVVKSTPHTFFHPDGTFNGDEFYSLLGNDIRRKILTKLSKFPRYTSDLAIDLGVSKQAVKKHLDRLEKFGIVEKSASTENQKKQFYQINSNIALFCQVDITPNYFALNVQNTPEEMVEHFKAQMHHNPETSLTSSRRERKDYHQLNFALKALGQQLHEVEQNMEEIEKKRRDALLVKTVLLNRIQIIINSLVENDLEKEVIFSLFFDTQSTIEGLTLEEILNQLFLRKKQRAGVSKYKYQKTDPKTIERGQEMLELLQMLIKNFGFIRTDESRLYFDFSEKKIY